MPRHIKDEIFMNRCLELALQGKGQVAPNPMVGALLVHNGRIIGEGFHQAYGQAHAEPNAVKNIVPGTQIEKSTLYVNLEPCSHHGKTPPCAGLIVDMNIPSVVIGTADPNPLVSGNGIKFLRESGIEVRVGILEDKCRDLNKRFFTFHLRKRPWVILKWARSADGFIDLVRDPDAPIGPNWITSPIARTLVHKWRTEEQAILVGTNTVIKDDPRLNVRYWSGRNPVRVVIDRSLKLDSHHHVFDNTQDTIVFTTGMQADAANGKPGMTAEKDSADLSVEHEINYETSGKPKTVYKEITFNDTAELQMMEALYNSNIQSVIIEGGAFTLNRFIKQGLWDEARIFTGPAYFKNGIRSPYITGNKTGNGMIGNSHLEIIYNTVSG